MDSSHPPFPFAQPCLVARWWVAVVVDHHPRRVMEMVVFWSEPSALDIIRFMRRICRRTECSPKHLITDHESQFTADAFATWCRHRGVLQCFGAIGTCGSLTVVEQSIQSMKNECTRAILVRFVRVRFQNEVDAYAAWFNANRSHSFLAGATPDEVCLRKLPACRKPRFEPRSRWPRPTPCALPQALVRGRPGVEVELLVELRAGRKHLPVVSLERIG